MPYIAALDIDPEGGNREEMHRHRVNADEVVEVLEDRPIITPNPFFYKLRILSRCQGPFCSF